MPKLRYDAGKGKRLEEYSRKGKAGLFLSKMEVTHGRAKQRETK